MWILQNSWNHSSSTRDFKIFEAFVMWKTQYSHFLLTVFSHCFFRQPNGACPPVRPYIAENESSKLKTKPEFPQSGESWSPQPFRMAPESPSKNNIRRHGSYTIWFSHISRLLHLYFFSYDGSLCWKKLLTLAFFGNFYKRTLSKRPFDHLIEKS